MVAEQVKDAQTLVLWALAGRPVHLYIETQDS